MCKLDSSGVFPIFGQTHLKNLITGKQTPNSPIRGGVCLGVE